MTPHTISRFSGLFTSVNPVSGVVPEGAMQIADNLVLRSSNILESRRGYYASSPIPEFVATPKPNTPFNATPFDQSAVVFDPALGRWKAVGISPGFGPGVGGSGYEIYQGTDPNPPPTLYSAGDYIDGQNPGTWTTYCPIGTILLPNGFCGQGV